MIDKYNIEKGYPADIIMKMACSTHAMHARVWRLFSHKVWFYKYDKKQPDFLGERENQWQISQKSNLITY
jgi:hypothetical protein